MKWMCNISAVILDETQRLCYSIIRLLTSISISLIKERKFNKKDNDGNFTCVEKDPFQKIADAFKNSDARQSS